MRDCIPPEIAKELATAIRGSGLKVQAAIAHVRGLDFKITVDFGNFRD